LATLRNFRHVVRSRRVANRTDQIYGNASAPATDGVQRVQTLSSSDRRNSRPYRSEAGFHERYYDCLDCIDV